jgi:hypothetical protein
MHTFPLRSATCPFLRIVMRREMMLASGRSTKMFLRHCPLRGSSPASRALARGRSLAP